MSAAKISAPRLEVKRVLNTPREEVFRAWTQANELKRWFSPTDDHRVEVPQLELYVGGTYRFEIHHKDGNVHRVQGIYREILPPEKLVFTWQWDGHCDAAVTVVTVEFAALGASTEVTITHELFRTGEDRQQHNRGWEGCLDHFARVYGS